MAPIKLLHSCLNCFNWRDTLSYLYKKICLLVGLSESGPAENKPFQALLSESTFSTRRLKVTSVPGFAEQMAAEQNPSLLGALLERVLSSPAKFLSAVWEQMGRIWLDSGRQTLDLVIFKAGSGESRWWVCGVEEVFVERQCGEELWFSLLFCGDGAWPRLAAQGAGSSSLLCSKERGCGIGSAAGGAGSAGLCVRPHPSRVLLPSAHRVLLLIPDHRAVAWLIPDTRA